MHIVVVFLLLLVQALFCAGQVETPSDPFVASGTIDCYETCQTSSLCVDVDPGANPLQYTNPACGFCIQEYCDLYRQGNTSALPDCIRQGRANCDQCAPLNLQQQRTLDTCIGCVRECSSRAQQTEIFSSPCTSYCQSVNYCPSNTEIVEALERETTNCRNCVVDRCRRFVDGTNQHSIADCLYYSRGQCLPCSTTSEERVAREVCENCVLQCGSRGAGVGRAVNPVVQPNRYNNYGGNFLGRLSGQAARQRQQYQQLQYLAATYELVTNPRSRYPYYYNNYYYGRRRGYRQRPRRRYRNTYYNNIGFPYLG